MDEKMDELGDSNRQDTRDTPDTEAPRSGLSRSIQRRIPPRQQALLLLECCLVTFGAVPFTPKAT